METAKPKYTRTMKKNTEKLSNRRKIKCWLQSFGETLSFQSIRAEMEYVVLIFDLILSLFHSITLSLQSRFLCIFISFGLSSCASAAFIFYHIKSIDSGDNGIGNNKEPLKILFKLNRDWIANTQTNITNMNTMAKIIQLINVISLVVGRKKLRPNIYNFLYTHMTNICTFALFYGTHTDYNGMLISFDMA